MSRQRFLLLMAAAILVGAIALLLATRSDQPSTTEGAALLPALANEVNGVTEITISKGASPAVTVHKTATGWTVAQRGEYPADVTKIRKLLLSLRDAKILEEKTSNPAEFSAIGVADPGNSTGDKPAAEPTGTLITLKGAGFSHAVIVGKPVGDGNFVRRAAENRSFAVEPAISIETEPRFWIDSRLLDIPVASLQTAEVKPVSGASYVLRRSNAADNAYSLEGVPAGRKALDAHALAPSPTTFGNLTADDVTAAADVDFSQAAQVVLTLSDGNVVTLLGTVVADKHWIEVKSSKDAALTAKARDRAFLIAGYRYDAIFKPLEQLLVPKEPPPGQQAKGAPGPGSLKKPHEPQSSAVPAPARRP